MPDRNTVEQMEIQIAIRVTYGGRQLHNLEDPEAQERLLFGSAREATLTLSAPYTKEHKFLNLAKPVEGVMLEVIGAHVMTIRGLYSSLAREESDRKKAAEAEAAEELERENGRARLGLVWRDGPAVDPETGEIAEEALPEDEEE